MQSTAQNSFRASKFTIPEAQASVKDLGQSTSEPELVKITVMKKNKKEEDLEKLKIIGSPAQKTIEKS